MITITSSFKTKLRSSGRQITAHFMMGETEIPSNNIKNLKAYYNGQLFKSIMRGVEFEYTGSLDLSDQDISLFIGVKLQGDVDYEYINLCTYKVIPSLIKEKIETNSKIIIAYDKTVESMVNYDLEIEDWSEMTVLTLLQSICTRLGWTLANTVFPNNNLPMEDLYSNQKVKFRDVLDEIAGSVSGVLYFNNSGQLVVKIPTLINDEVIGPGGISKLNFGDKFGPINSIVLSVVEADDGSTTEDIFIKDDESIALNGLQEVKIAKNAILNQNRNVSIVPIFDALHNLVMYPVEIESWGFLIYEPGDIIMAKDLANNEKPILILESETNITTGLKEKLYSTITKKATTQYQYADPYDKRITKAEIEVRKNAGEILFMAESIGDISILEGGSVTNSINKIKIDAIETKGIIEENKYLYDNLGNKVLISNKVNEITENVDGLFVDLKRTGNNILQGTQFKTLDSWMGNYPIKPYKQGISFPSSPSYEDYFYNTQTGQMWQFDSTNIWIKTNTTRKTLEETINPPINFTIIEDNETKSKALSERYGRLFAGPSASNNIAAISHKLEVINTNMDYMNFHFNFINNIIRGTAQIDIIEHTTDILDNTNIISDRVYRKSITYNSASEDEYLEVVIPIIKQKNAISNAFINSDIGTPPTDITKIWLLRLNSNQARVLKYDIDSEEWVDNNDLFNPIRDVELSKYWVRTHPKLYTSTSNQNMDARYITVGLNLGYTVIEHQSETAPLNPLPYTAWGNTLTDEVKVPIFEDGEFTDDWEILDQTLSDALANDAEHPFLYASGYYEFYDIKVEYGTVSTEWNGNENEIVNANYALTTRGLLLTKGDRKTILDDDEIKSTKNGETKWELTDDGMFSKTAKTEQLDINGFVTKTIDIDLGAGVRNVCINYKI